MTERVETMLRAWARDHGMEDGDPLLLWLEAVLRHARGAPVLAPDAEAELMRRLEVRLQSGLPKLAQAMDRRTGALVAGALVAALAVGFGMGWALEARQRGRLCAVMDTGRVERASDGRRYCVVTQWIDHQTTASAVGR